MDFSNWLYLGLGTFLGVGISRVTVRSSTHQSSPPADNTPRLQQQLQQTQLAYHMAREMSQFKSGFLARTSHELRSPLNGLIGLHQLILADLCENPEEEREFIAQAHDRALKLVNIIDEIINVARTEHGKNQLNLQPIQLVEYIEQVYKLTHLLAANRNFPVNFSYPEPDIYVLADGSWLKQILLNLVETIIAQMEEGSIYLASNIAPQNKLVNIWIDAPTHALTLSEPIDFMQSDLPKEKVTLSVGMKLFLNQILVELMGGKLEILTSPIVDTTQEFQRIQISLPLVVN
ncbi:histidine kinase HepN [Richelia sinica FACHB-800]|uniref:histidine kinase n=1 Tax=Richelia sinica FACHB-800 TaxID=1357546 RepID=A0A975Y7G8_9NOST|nr:HAMP domain-containing sensor histidine kinase [Richelia sinica]MBD2663948.1 HAMP domain-containing histidine kinase [Richelia sinica FACHB-800]QXE26323.1 histidine kinase HepN [Richelia sinica FACHB-800]